MLWRLGGGLGRLGSHFYVLVHFFLVLSGANATRPLTTRATLVLSKLRAMPEWCAGSVRVRVWHECVVSASWHHVTGPQCKKRSKKNCLRARVGEAHLKRGEQRHIRVCLAWVWSQRQQQQSSSL